MFCKKNQLMLENMILDHAYEIENDEDIYTYSVTRIEDKIYKVLEGHFFLSIRGEYMIYRLESKGYLSIDQIYQKYNLSEIPTWNEAVEPKKGMMKKFFRQKPKCEKRD